MRRSLVFLIVIAGALVHAARVDTLAEAVERSENFKVRLKATKSLARHDTPRAIETLIFALTDRNALVRATAANALGKKGTRAALPKLCVLLRDTDPFVNKTAVSALASFGGVAVCEGAQKVFLRVAVSGGAPENSVHVEQSLRGHAQADRRVLLEPSDEAQHRLELMIRVGEFVNRGGAQVSIRCEMSQSVYILREGDQRSLKGSATQRAEVALGLTATEQAVAGQMRACIDALVPAVYGGFSGFLDELR